MRAYLLLALAFPCAFAGTYTVCGYTSKAGHSDTVGEVATTLQSVGNAPSAVQNLFSGADKGAKKCTDIEYSSWPTKLTLAIDDTNGWGYWKITIDGCTVVRASGGESSDPWWLDLGSDTNPESIELDVPDRCENYLPEQCEDFSTDKNVFGRGDAGDCPEGHACKDGWGTIYLDR
jgi:hypothetical protein